MFLQNDLNFFIDGLKMLSDCPCKDSSSTRHIPTRAMKSWKIMIIEISKNTLSSQIENGTNICRKIGYLLSCLKWNRHNLNSIPHNKINQSRRSHGKLFLNLWKWVLNIWQFYHKDQSIFYLNLMTTCCFRAQRTYFAYLYTRWYDYDTLMAYLKTLNKVGQNERFFLLLSICLGFSGA